jgi:hypothetical protein
LWDYEFDVLGIACDQRDATKRGQSGRPVEVSSERNHSDGPLGGGLW